MRRRITLLVAATTSAVVLAFVVPLCLLVRNMAEDRAMANASQEARNMAVLVSGLADDPRLPDLVVAVDRRTSASTSVLTDEGQVLGSPAPGMASDPEVRRARQGQAFSVVDEAGGRLLVPVVTPAGTEVVRTTVSSATLHRGVVRAWLTIAGLGLLLLVAAVWIADRLGRRVSTPVTELAQVAHRLREGDLEARVVPTGPPETVELGNALNRLAARITDLLAAERAAVGDLSHRLRTPVTALRLDAEAVEQPDVAERLQGHVGHLQRTIDAIVKEARRPVRSSMGSTCDATTTVSERVQFWTALAEDQARRLDVHLPGQAERVAVDAADLRDIVDVLVDNVFAHTPEGTPFEIGLHADDTVSPVVLAVRDRGPGMDVAGDRDNRDNRDTAGSAPRSLAGPRRPGFTGLGLQIVRRTAAGFGGQVRVSSEPGRGTQVEVVLPRRARQTSS